MTEDFETIRDLAKTLSETSVRLKKEAEDLNRRAQEIESAIKKNKAQSA
jgi:hypothetical protein